MQVVLVSLSVVGLILVKFTVEICYASQPKNAKINSKNLFLDFTVIQDQCWHILKARQQCLLYSEQQVYVCLQPFSC